MGNVCRSPTAEGVFRQLVKDAELEKLIDIDSAGTHAYHLGDSPDPRAISIASGQGIDLTGLVARHVVESDFVCFNHILAMDRSNLLELQQIRPVESTTEPRLLLDYAPEMTELEVPDPYLGTLGDYRLAMDLICAGARGFLQEIATITIEEGGLGGRIL
jgi:protein-tyrosine phosphatase